MKCQNIVLQIMTTLIVLPTQLYPRSKIFWNQWSEVIVIEESHYINKLMHPLKLWFHRASMLEYFDSIPHKSKKYIRYDSSFTTPDTFSICHPTDKAMVDKYKKGTILENPSFILTLQELDDFDTSGHDIFYKKMRIKLGLLMNGDKPVGGKWSYDTLNRKKYPQSFEETNPLDRSMNNKFITQAKDITKLSNITDKYITSMIWTTNRKSAMKDMKEFVKYRLSEFGPYQDAISQNIVVGNHSCLSATLNIGLITPNDIIKEVMKYDIPIESIEGFLRQIIGWREYIRMKYIIHGLVDWSYLKGMNNSMPKSWYDATTGIETLDWSIDRVVKYSYSSHIERLMLLLNYATLLRLKYEDVRKWFVRMFIDGYDWVMLNVSMGVNGLSPHGPKFMKRAYLTNGTYLMKMGIKMSKEDLNQLKELYNDFIKDNKALAKRDYRLASAVKRLS